MKHTHRVDPVQVGLMVDDEGATSILAPYLGQ
jgi:hypothetical protein